MKKYRLLDLLPLLVFVALMTGLIVQRSCAQPTPTPEPGSITTFAFGVTTTAPSWTVATITRTSSIEWNTDKGYARLDGHTGKVTLPAGLGLDEGSRSFYDALEKYATRRVEERRKLETDNKFLQDENKRLRALAASWYKAWEVMKEVVEKSALEEGAK